MTQQRLPEPRRARRARLTTRLVGSIAALLCAALLVTFAPALHLFGSRPLVIYPARNSRVRVAAVMLSGDMGFGYGMSGYVAKALAERGVTVVGVVSPVAFAFHRSHAQAVEGIGQAIRTAMTISGAQHVVLVGQSYGADIVADAAPDLPRDLLAHVDAIDLVVPGRNVYFRADPSGLAYLGQADSHPARALNAFRGAPLICIYGIEESDSLCPQLATPAAVIGLTGNHYLHHDHTRLIATDMGALHSLVPAIRR